MTAERAPDEERPRVRREHGEEHRHHSPEAELGDVADEQEAADPRSHPRDAEQRDAERRRRGLPHSPEAVDDEREHEGREQPAEHPLDPAELEPEQRRDEAEVAPEHERPKLARHHVQLVEREQAADEREPEQPPATEVDEPDDERQEDRRHEDTREQGAHRAPNRRPRLAYSSTAARSRSSPKSGQRVSSNTSSA